MEERYGVKNGRVVKWHTDGKLFEFLTFDAFTEKQAEYIAMLLNSETRNNGDVIAEFDADDSYTLNIAQKLLSLASDLYLEKACSEPDPQSQKGLAEEMFSVIKDWQPETEGQDWEFVMPLSLRVKQKKLKITVTVETETE
jgi:hypothetical protein